MVFGFRFSVFGFEKQSQMRYENRKPKTENYAFSNHPH